MTLKLILKIGLDINKEVIHHWTEDGMEKEIKSSLVMYSSWHACDWLETISDSIFEGHMLVIFGGK
jgi:hypothetical protein